ncbi:glutamate-rich WD repeat-containing protein 1 [Bombyx mandarina]|uniref:Glutamate-rich WD repeat-containing protein 1 n=2 Tax=Bombyx TaxID=7090 RepID=A0A8R2ASG4_BOMMO|nr:glutamate-rich WD repeat-containing protein 1 [Bombyx mori]XP_028036280.1 glutamate-rich WD repeat-containing protein 1 [Bombyx mandarina]
MSNEADERMDSSSENEDDEMNEEAESDQNDDRPKTYLPDQPLKEDEQLVCDHSAYVMLHQAQTGAPCLSFDIVTDNLGNDRNEFPMTAYLVAGTQASSAHLNNLLVIKMSNLHPISKPEEDEESEDDDSDDEDEEQKPQMTFSFIKHQGCVNRIRATNFKNSVLAASWSELGRVDIWNITQQLQAVDDPVVLERYNLETVSNPVKPIYSFNGHQQEGFALDWCPTESGMLATGDCRRDIHIWRPNEGGTWTVDQRPLVGHTSSVEDIQWSPNERNVLATCSVDKTIRIWDTRAAPQKACMLTAENAHQSDINVISWNGKEPFIASGGDDGFLHIWDLRQFTNSTPVGTFKHHTAPVTSVEWHWTEPSVLASAGEDNQVALWDLAVEKDDDEVEDDDELKNLPPQLLFIHQGQTDIKELHWHKQLPGVIVTTAHTGFNIFKTISV